MEPIGLCEELARHMGEIAIGFSISALPTNEVSFSAEMLLGEIEFRSPGVGAYFDFGNSLMLGSDPVADIGILKDRIAQVHVKDPRKDRTPCYLGEGDVDLEGCLRALEEIDYSGPLVFETPPLDDARATASRNLATLKSLIEKASG